MTAYYNENDPKAAAWLRELIKAGLIAPGDVDERSIEDVVPTELAGYTQCHFFAGVGAWSYALRLAGWPDSRQAWTGSCPCQPFSAAGKRGGASDERHLWPAFYWLIDQRRPAVVFGEQVASTAGREWLAGVRADLEAVGYAVGAADLCAAGVGAPHIRQRLWWVADSRSSQRQRWSSERGSTEPHTAKRQQEAVDDKRSGAVSRLEYPTGDGWHQRRAEPGGRGAGGVGDTGGTGAGRHGRAVFGAQAPGESPRQESGYIGDGAVDAGAANPWRDAIWIPCADGKARRIEPGLEPLVDGAPARVGRLRGYGNCIVPQVAAQFIAAYLEAA